MNQAQAEPAQLPAAARGAPQSLELRHLRYFVALADAGCFTKAAEKLFIAQPTLSQQIRRLEEIVGTSLMHRRRDGLNSAGFVVGGHQRDQRRRAVFEGPTEPIQIDQAIGRDAHPANQVGSKPPTRQHRGVLDGRDQQPLGRLATHSPYAQPQRQRVGLGPA